MTRVQYLGTAFASLSFVSILLGFSPKVDASSACINIYHDRARTDNLADVDASIHLLMKQLKNIRVLPQNLIPIDRYQAGSLESCDYNIYLGVQLDQGIPQDFLKDFLSTKKKVVWIGFNIWQLGEQLEKKLGFKYLGLTRWDSRYVDKKRRAFYYNEIFFKEKKFFRIPPEDFPLSQFSKVQADKIEILPVNFDKFEALAESRHGVTREVLPYIVRAQNLYYVAEIPDAFIQGALSSQFLSDVL